MIDWRPFEIVCPKFDVETWRKLGRKYTGSVEGEFPAAADDGTHRLMGSQRITQTSTQFRCRCSFVGMLDDMKRIEVVA